MKDYYKILGVDKSVSQDEIKKAYRKLAHQYHPDKIHGGDEQKFKELNEAYQTLGNEQKRKQYDQFGRAGGEGGFDFSQGFDFGNSGFDFSRGGNFRDAGFDVEELFRDFFGFESAGPWEGREKRGKDIAIDLEISFKEMVFGTVRQVLLRKNNICSSCGGSGGEPGQGEEICSLCQGSGTIRHAKKSFIGTFTALKECDKCSGKGRVPKKACKICGGIGIIKGEKEVRIAIPSGIEDNEAIKLSGEGEATKRGVPGDLYARIHVKTHPVFEREGKHLLMNLEISLTEAALGAEKRIETLDGEIPLEIPVGIDSGEILRLKGKGVVVNSRERGDLLIQVLIKTPKRLSRKARELFEELKKEGV